MNEQKTNIYTQDGTDIFYDELKWDSFTIQKPVFALLFNEWMNLANIVNNALPSTYTSRDSDWIFGKSLTKTAIETRNK